MSVEIDGNVVALKATMALREQAAEDARDRSLDETLPELTATQTWCCAGGCGDCSPKEIAFPYSIIRDAETDELIERRTHRAYVSNCCGADLMLWDESVGTEGDFVEFSLYPQQGHDIPSSAPVE